MTTAIIGWTGFIGQILTSKIKGADLYNSSNIHDIRNKTYDIIYFCGMPAEKWKINKSPEIDYKNTLELFDILKTVNTNKFILISTVDVFDCTVPQYEDGNIFASHAYGKHRKMMEDFIINSFSHYHILRLPGLFGRGLKKNIIYDLIFDNQINNICLKSEFQWYNAENILDDINKCILNNIKCVNLVSPPITVETITNRYFPDKSSMAEGSNIVKYCLKTRTGTCGYWSDTEDVLIQLGNYIQYEMKLKSRTNKLVVSNIAWKWENTKDILKVLNSFRINSLEVAFTKIADWNSWTEEVIANLKTFDVNFVSSQSILFNTNINVFLDSDRLLEHYTKVAEICNNLGITKIVFGSPKARHLGNTSINDAITLFRKIGDIGEKFNVVCCLEPNATQYGCTWLTNLNDTVQFVEKVNHKYVLINYDLGNYLMENDTFKWNSDTAQLIGHVQVSNMFLKPLIELDSVLLNQYSKQFYDIKQLGYTGSISLEMVESNIFDLINSLRLFVNL
jgi:sugar phosphate isomerase/epimerase